MAITLIDGTVLPDISEGYECFSYITILRSQAINDAGECLYMAFISDSSQIFASPDLTGTVSGGLMCTNALSGRESNDRLCSLNPDTNAWQIYDDDPTSNRGQCPLDIEFGSYFTLSTSIAWSNHDILEIAGVDETTGEITYADEPYFPSSVASAPPFVLPDGTEFPALPDGCFDGTPYGVISRFDDGDCSVVTTQSPAYVEENEDSIPVVFFPVGTERLWFLIDGVWQFFLETENDAPVEWMPFAENPVVWSNYDMMHGTEIARKSDVNYRITDGRMRSIANEARRLGASSASLTPADIEAIFRAVTAASDDDTGGDTGTVEIVTWADGTDEQIAAMVAAMDAGTLSIEDTGWAVGDERQVTLSAMEATGVGESHAEQTVTLVLMDSQHYTLTEATAGGDTKDHFVVGLKNCLNEAGYMNSSYTNSGYFSSTTVNR